MATEEAENPDLRDRAYIYWRMLSTAPEKAAEVVLGDKPNISHDSYNTYEGTFVEELLCQISSICSIYHKTPQEMQKLYGITEASGMVSHVTSNKLEKGAQMASDIAKRPKVVKPAKDSKKEESKGAKEKKVKDKKDGPKRMDDSSDDEKNQPK